MHDSMTSAALGRAFLELLPVTGVSIAVFADATKRSTIYASDPVAARIDELQFDLGEGPSFDAVRDSRPMLVGDLGPATSDRWPLFADGLAGAASDVRAGTAAQALFVFPLMMGAICVGVASLYRTSPGDLDQDEVDTGMSTARSIAGPALRHAVRLSEQEHVENDGSNACDSDSGRDSNINDALHNGTGLNGTDSNGTDSNGTDFNRTDRNGTDLNGTSLNDTTVDHISSADGTTSVDDTISVVGTTGGIAIELRRDIHQATGMVLAQLNISATDAFSRLRAYAFSTNRTVQEVARDVLARRLDFSQLSDDSR